MAVTDPEIAAACNNLNPQVVFRFSLRKKRNYPLVTVMEKNTEVIRRTVVKEKYTGYSIYRRKNINQ